MNAPISDPTHLELLPDEAKPSEAVMAELNSASILESIQFRESTLAPVTEPVFEFRPSSHWGINE